MVVEIERFFGVYLLLNVNPQFKDRTYIGYTVDPKRRISQHNKGVHFGGAKRTNGRGPWEMVLIVYGFPNNISALQFEWAWQKPTISRRVRHVPGKRKDEKRFMYNLRVLFNMLQTTPWRRLPLTVQWIKQEYMREFEDGLQPPPHMPIAFGPITSIKMHSSKKKKSPQKKKKTKDVKSTLEEENKDAAQRKSDDMVDMISLTQTVNKRCDLCMKRIQEGESSLSCVHPACSMFVHTICLATKFLKRSSETDQLLPVDGNCPICKNSVLWGDLIRKKEGCYSNLSASEENEDSEDHWAEDLRL